MIRRTWPPDKWMLVNQIEHARIAGLIAAAWQPPNGSRLNRETVLAVARHDDGWKAFDAEPQVNESGAPLSFMEMDPLKSTALWMASATDLEKENHPYAARLVAGHFSHLASEHFDMARLSPRGAAALGGFLGSQRVLMERCRRKILENGNTAISDLETVFDGDPPPPPRSPLDDFDRDLRFLQVCDMLSLLLVTDFTGSTEIGNVPYLSEGDKLRVSRVGDKLALTFSPLPFRKNVRDHVTGVLVPRRVYTNPADLQAAVKATKPSVNEFHIGAAG